MLEFCEIKQRGCFDARGSYTAEGRYGHADEAHQLQNWL
jgi:hypothetical protein